jgi:hypothetical protein
MQNNSFLSCIHPVLVNLPYEETRLSPYNFFGPKRLQWAGS